MKRRFIGLMTAVLVMLPATTIAGADAPVTAAKAPPPPTLDLRVVALGAGPHLAEHIPLVGVAAFGA